MIKINKSKGFTLIEMIISITIFAIVIILAFDALGNIGILRNKVSDRMDLNTDLYYSMENLVSTIKDFGGQIDYEEYWNRQAVGIETQSGHYLKSTGFGNYGFGNSNVYGSGFYYCRSGILSDMGTGGCLTNYNDAQIDESGSAQRYGEYSFQFIDYNSNKNDDTTTCTSQGNPGMELGDENCDSSIRGDDDDENLGIGPLAFSGNEVKELYLINKGQKSTRLLLRLNIKQDPSVTYTCGNDGTGSGCLGNIEMLKLDGRDLGFSHTGAATSTGRYDGIVDTWECNADFNCSGANNLPSGTGSEWVSIFPDYINVKNVRFFVFPNKDYKLSWKDNDPNANINPYIRLNITLGYAWSKRKMFKNSNPIINVSTTINLNKS